MMAYLSSSPVYRQPVHPAEGRGDDALASWTRAPVYDIRPGIGYEKVPWTTQSTLS